MGGAALRQVKNRIVMFVRGKSNKTISSIVLELDQVD